VPGLRNRLPQPGLWMVRLQRFLAIPMAATAVACLWLLYRQAGTGAFVAGLLAVVLLAILLLWTGWAQRRGMTIGWLALVAGLILAGVAATQVPRQSQAAARIPLGAEAWSEAAVEKHLAAGRPVFVYFTADWCLTCKANEAAAIEREATREAFKKAGVKVLVGDWTNGDPEITRFLESRGRAGVPLYLWYEPGEAEPEELAQILTPGMLTSRAQRRR
jgi:thiol:disulfide interchange protein